MHKQIFIGLIGSIAAAAAAQPSATSTSPTGLQAPTRPGELSFYESMDFGGDFVVIDHARSHIRTTWNVRSVGIHPGERWQLCARSRYREPCIILDRSVHDARLIGVEGQIGSARPASEVPAGNPNPS